MSKEAEHIMILASVPGSITSKQIAQDLVSSKAAACVNIVPGVTSYFRWGNKVETDEEFMLLIKTTSARFTAVQNTIKSLHPHELPEIIAVSIKDGLTGYLRWIEESTK